MAEPPSFGYWLRRRRKALDLTQAALARQVGCAPITIQKIELEERRPSQQIAERLAAVLELRPAERESFLSLARWERGGVALPDPAETALSPLPDLAEAPREAILPEAAPQRRSNLQPYLSSFIGRQQTLAELRRLLAEPAARLLTLTGMGGAGKTRLALELAGTLLERFRDGVWLVELAPLMDPAFIPDTIATVLGIRQDPGQLPLSRLISSLASQQLLIVLDNCEHLILACAQLAETLLRACPGLVLLATSREALGIGGETVLPLPPLPVPPLQQQLPLEQLREFEGIALFLDRAQAAMPGFAVTAQSAPALVEICARLDGLPLAIELAATRVRTLSLEQLAARMDQRFGLLTSGNRAAQPRHQTLQALIDWSYQLLTSTEQRLFRQLALFAGSWTIEAAEAVCASEELPVAEVLGVMLQLADKSLIVLDQQPAEQRYRMLESLRQYGVERLGRRGEETAVRTRHLRFYLGLAEAAELGLQGPAQLRWLQRLEAEHDNLRAALEWSLSELSGPLIEAGLQLAACLREFWHRQAYWDEGSRWLERLLKRAQQRLSDAAPSSAYARALGAAGYIAQALGDLAVARARLQAGLELCQQLVDPRGAVLAQADLAWVELVQCSYADARAWLEPAEQAARALGDRWCLATVLLRSGYVCLVQRRLEQGQLCLEESLALFQSLSPISPGAAFGLLGLGYIAMERRDYEAARDVIERGYAIYQQLDDPLGISGSLNALGELARLMGDGALAADYYERCLAITRQIGGPADLAMQLHNLGHALLHQGDVELAEDYFLQSLATCSPIEEFKLGVTLALSGLAGVAAARGRGGPGQPGQPDAAERALTLFGAVDALLRAYELELNVVDQQEHDRNLALASALLAEERRAAAWADGQRLSVEQAIALVGGPSVNG